MNIEGCSVTNCEITGEENVGIYYGRLISDAVCDPAKNSYENVKINGTAQ